MLMYNGQRDGSVCNHLGNLLAILQLNYNGIEKFKETNQKQLKLSDGSVAGYIRTSNNLSYITVVNTGHLVPMFVPEVSAYMINGFINNTLNNN